MQSRKLPVHAFQIIVLLLLVGCRGPMDSVAVIVERHNKALKSMPPSDRSRLMPFGEAVVGTEVQALLPTELIDLETARSIAVRANPDVHAAQARLESARARILEGQARYYPNIIFSHNSTRTFQTPASRNRLSTLLQPSPVIPTNVDTGDDAGDFALTSLLNAIRSPLFGGNGAVGSTNSFSEHSSALTATWTIFDGFVREARVLASKHLYRASVMGLADVERLIVQAVDRAYHQVQLAQEQVRITEADAEFSQDQLEETERLRAAGRATVADVNNFRVRLLAAQANLTAAIGSRETGRVVLAELMGISDVDLPDGLRLTSLVDETQEEMTLPQVQPWIEGALVNRPDIVQFEQVLESEEERVRAVKGLFSPTLTASGSWGFDRGSTIRYTSNDQSSAAGVEFRWEIFTGGARTAQLRQAEADRAEAAAALNRLRLAVQSDVHQSIIDIDQAQGQIILQRQTLETSRENRRIVQAGYLAGKEPLSRLNEAQRDYIEADARLARARIRLRQSWSDLAAAAATYRESSDEPRSRGAADDSAADDG